MATTTTAPYPTADIAAAVDRGRAAANDGPDPDLDANRSAQKYAGMARDFRVSAWEHLAQGDLPKASNKGWGWWRKPSRLSAPSTAGSFTLTALLWKWPENWPG